MSKPTSRPQYRTDYAMTPWPRLLANGADQRVVLEGGALVRAWGEFLGRVPWQVLVTLTFDPKRVFPVGQELVTREAVAWCNDVARALRRPIAWVIAPERGRSGQWHAHVLVVGTDAEALRAVASLWKTRNGYIDLQPVRHGNGTSVALYASKEAAMTGAAVLSDTIRRYLPGGVAHQRHQDQAHAAADLTVVKLYP